MRTSLPGHPSKVYLGHRTFRIRWVPRSLVQAQNVDAFVDLTGGEIFIANDLPMVMRADRLLHECLHIIYCHTEMGKLAGDEGEERMVSVMAHGVTELFRRNPQLKKWFSTAVSS